MERFTILICTFNRAASLAETIDVTASLDAPFGYDILVLDNRSTDNTAEVVRAAAARYAVPIRYLREEQPGKSAALNAGIKAAHGEIVAFTDDDAKPQKDWLVRLDAAFDKYRADWIFGRVVPEWTTGAPRWYSRELEGMFALLDYGPDPFVVTSTGQTFFGVNCAATKQALLTLGAYRTDLGPAGYGGGGEDVDMFWRALAAHMRVVYVPDAVVAHVIPGSRTRKQFHRRKLFTSRALDHKLVTESAEPPTLLGLPRYLYQAALSNAAGLIGARLRLKAGLAFYHELRLLRFAALLERAIRTRWR